MPDVRITWRESLITVIKMAEEAAGSVKCPVCAGEFKSSKINDHLDKCLDQSWKSEDEPPAKKSRASSETESDPGAPGEGTCGAGVKPSRPPVFSLFNSSSSKSLSSSQQRSAEGMTRGTASPSNAHASATLPGSEAETRKQRDEAELLKQRLLSADKPLAEKMRPNTLEEYFGQNKVLGEHTLLRGLLQSQEVPSLILWGPPGCGKTTLAHIIASSSKKKGTARFVTLSATSTSTNEVREVIKQAQNELRLCKRKTILFIDEIHRFNKLQQDTFLPHVECGTITLIGATTENPSFQVNSALLSRCRVLVLEKLSVSAMSSILRRAVDSLGLIVLPDNCSGTGHSAERQVFIEQKALDTIAHLCDGDARAALNGLQLAVQACMSKTLNRETHTPQDTVVQEEHVKEGLQRSHILYDRAGEEHYNCISALHKSMRGSDENAALYWLGRMLEGGEDPLYVARRLVRFASEDVGLADPAALPQAVSAFQACHFIGMPECEVILAQCALYLARAPKSIEVYRAYNNVKACLRNHKGPLPPVPLHLRNAPTKLMKEIGYAKGYKYNPAFKGPVDQEYLPEELRGINFFTWTPSD
ncbi:ATPase WRNIP1 [Clarias gariepinus]|uniref:ATPase WRNIP1 n=1 Tax=Clarias gariepinus TaxID=13013 RepID=UPI00234CC6B7|nr:ATPase WRNIP1 [Clarias gariepinus]